MCSANTLAIGQMISDLAKESQAKKFKLNKNSIPKLW
jgi:hypothetical protein